MAFFDLVKSPSIVVPFTLSTFPEPVFKGDHETYEVTGMSPQSSTVAQLLNGFVFRGTLYPPLNVGVNTKLA
jgi:hypothetical protein